MSAEAVLDVIERQQSHIVECESANAHDETLSDARRAHARSAVEWANNDHRVLEDNRPLFERAMIER
ncbi:hypothetical protein [Humibacter ginsengisoli]